jgi:hypothetical protein
MKGILRMLACVLPFVILVLAGCEQKKTTGQAVRRTLGTSIASAPTISVTYSYGGDVGRHGIASEAKFRTVENGESFAVAHGAELCDEDRERRLRATFDLPCDGNQRCSIVARFRFTGQGAQIRKATLDQRWETRYIFQNEDADLRLGIPRVETYDLTTGKKVAETRNIKLVALGGGKPEDAVSSKLAKDFSRRVISQTWSERRWGFSGEECCYEGGKLVFLSSFVRDLATGLMVSEIVNKGSLPRDYHHYELVVISWPDGEIPGTKIDLVPVVK